MRIKIKKVNCYFISFFLIFFLCIFYIVIYNKYFNDKLFSIAQIKVNKMIFKSINEISSNLFSTNDYQDIITIYKNDNGEILYVDYNMKCVYELLNNFKNKLDDKLISSDDLMIDIPLLSATNNYLLSGIGPVIKLGISYDDTYILNVSTKVTNYGINNALLEVYINIDIESKLIMPFKDDENILRHSVLVASKVVNGKVPFLYGDSFTNDSSLFNFSN